MKSQTITTEEVQTVVVPVKQLQITFTEKEAKLLNLIGYTSANQREKFFKEALSYTTNVSTKDTEDLSQLLANLYFAAGGFNK